MKLRIQGDSIRLRLTQSELGWFQESGRVESATHFLADRILRYSLSMSDKALNVRAEYEENCLRVVLPSAMAREWAESDQVGIEASVDNELPNGLHVLVEKDFQCLHRRGGEDEADQFPNPALD